VYGFVFDNKCACKRTWERKTIDARKGMHIINGVLVENENNDKAIGSGKASDRERVHT
jgi:hypothetical protein